VPDPQLRLRPLRREDEAAFVAAHAAMKSEGFEFGLRFDLCPSFDDYLAALDGWRDGLDIPSGMVPSTFLVADAGGVIVGRTSIRHRFNEFLEREGGHIGYCVLAEHRRRGYASEILHQSLVIVRSFGVERVLVTCDEHNVASATVIERCGGVFESMVDSSRGGPPKRRYWID
jgi:predicted acetyltransferase